MRKRSARPSWPIKPEIQPDREALVVGDRSLTWRELDEGANRAANMLLTLGARHGDRIMMMLGNSVEFVEIYYGLAKIGCIPRAGHAALGRRRDRLYLR